MTEISAEQFFGLAQQGDLDAMSQWLNLQLKDLTVQIADLTQKQDRLQISVEAIDIPEQSAVVSLLQAAIQSLGLSTVNNLAIYGQKVGQELPFWMDQCSIAPDSLSHSTHVDGLSLSIEKQNGVIPEKDKTQDRPAEISGKGAEIMERYASGVRDFTGLDLSEIELPDVNLNLANLKESKLIWANLQGATLWQANLSSTKLRHINLGGANLYAANLQGADLQGANLKGANLSCADLRGANLTEADLTDANLKNAKIQRVIMPDGTLLD